MATAALVATDPPALIPIRAVPRSAVDQPAAPSLVSEHPLDEVAMTLTLNAIRSDSAEANACTCHGEWRHIVATLGVEVHVRGWHSERLHATRQQQRDE